MCVYSDGPQVGPTMKRCARDRFYLIEKKLKLLNFPQNNGLGRFDGAIFYLNVQNKENLSNPLPIDIHASRWDPGANLLTTRECGKVSSKIYIVHYSTFHATSSFWISKFDRMTNDKRDICF